MVARSYGHTPAEWDGALGRIARSVAEQTGNVLTAYAQTSHEATRFTFQCPLCRKRWSDEVAWQLDQQAVIDGIFALAERHIACDLALGPAGRSP